MNQLNPKIMAWMGRIPKTQTFAAGFGVVFGAQNTNKTDIRWLAGAPAP